MSCGTFEESQARVQGGGIYADAAAVFIFSSIPPRPSEEKEKKSERQTQEQIQIIQPTIFELSGYSR